MIIFLLIYLMVSSTLAHYIIPNSGSPNVGSVLFAESDLKKPHWSKTSIAILQARKYVQKIIPTPQLTSSVNEEYITNLLNYFENSFKTVKRETKYPFSQNVLDIALSDALGGYLKVFVLPITKYAYYAGTVSLDSSLKLFKAYEDIKRSLKTDGRGWRSPNKNLLKSVAINIISQPFTPISSKGNPCEQLAYYEKTDTGLKIPMPYINWDTSPPTMFLPLVNQSIVSLSAPSSSSSLLKYYAVADKCIKSQFPKVDDFYKRFQKWLSVEVAPHLSDEKFYAAFGSVLSLMNSTKRFCSVHLLRDPITVRSKRFFIIALILLIEFVWCIPTMIYTMWLRRKKRLEQNKNNKCIHTLKSSLKSLSKCNFNKKISTCYNKMLTPKQPTHGLKLFVEPKTTNLEVDAQFPSIDSKHNVKLVKSRNKSSLKRQNFSYFDVMTLANEVPSKSSSSAKVPVSNTSTLIKNSYTKDNTILRKASYSVVKTNVKKVQEFTAAYNLTPQNSEKTINEITYSQENIELFDKNSSNTKCNIVRNSQKISNECFRVVSLKDKTNEEKSKVTENEPREKRGNLKNKEKEKKSSSKTVMFSQTDTIYEKQEGTMIDASKIKANKKNCKLNSSDQPLLRIFIERPQNSITVGITTFKGLRSTTKPSKIPRAVRTVKETNNSVSKPTDSYIIRREPIIKGKALDDSSIKQIPIEDKKLNLTL